MLLRKYIAILCAVFLLISTASAGVASATMDVPLPVDSVESDDSVGAMPCHTPSDEQYTVDDQLPTNACAEHNCSSCLLGSVILSALPVLDKTTHTSTHTEQATSYAVRLYLDAFYRPPIIS